MQELWVQFLVRELRSHMPCGQKTKKTWNRSNIVTNSIRTLKKKVQIKKIFKKQFRYWIHGQVFYCSLYVLVCEIVYYFKKTILNGMKLGITGRQLSIKYKNKFSSRVGCNELTATLHPYIHTSNIYLALTLWEIVNFLPQKGISWN